MMNSLGEKRAHLSAFQTFVRFALVWFCLFPLPLGVWEGLRLVTVALPGLFSYHFFNARNKTLTAKLLQQSYRYHKLRKAFSQFYRRHYDLVTKYDTGLKTLLL